MDNKSKEAARRMLAELRCVLGVRLQPVGDELPDELQSLILEADEQLTALEGITATILEARGALCDALGDHAPRPQSEYLEGEGDPFRRFYLWLATLPTTPQRLLAESALGSELYKQGEVRVYGGGVPPLSEAAIRRIVKRFAEQIKRFDAERHPIRTEKP